jgi:small basic protein
MKPASTPDISSSTKEKIALRNNWLKVGLATAFCGVVCYRLVTAPFSVDLTGFSFNDLLALVLAIFSISLSVAFYFKATDTSNEFYDNTYRFTKDISEILGRIEAGFGERLKHLDEGYTGLRNRFDRIPLDEGKAKEEIAEEEKQVQKVEEEKTRLLEDLARRAKLQEAEKHSLFEKLSQKDTELARTRAEIDFMRRRLERAEALRQAVGEDRIPEGIRRYISQEVVPALGMDVVLAGPRSILRKRFYEVREKFHPEFIKDAERLGIVDAEGMLSDIGARVIRAASRPTENA